MTGLELALAVLVTGSASVATTHAAYRQGYADGSSQGFRRGAAVQHVLDRDAPPCCGRQPHSHAPDCPRSPR